MKIILRESQVLSLKTKLYERIDPSVAYKNISGLKSVINGDRGVGYVVYSYNDPDFDTLNSLMADERIKIIKVKHQMKDVVAYLVYRNDHEADAYELYKILKKNKGFLPNTDPYETYRIGVLLGYDIDKVREYVVDKFPEFKLK